MYYHTSAAARPLSSSVRFLTIPMLPWPKIIVTCFAAIVAAADIVVIAQRFYTAAPEPISWSKLAIAFSLQCAALFAAAIFRVSLHRIFTDGLKGNRITTLPLFAIVAACAFSLQYLYVAVVCGSQPLPTHRGQPMCSAVVSVVCPK